LPAKRNEPIVTAAISSGIRNVPWPIFCCSFNLFYLNYLNEIIKIMSDISEIPYMDDNMMKP